MHFIGRGGDEATLFRLAGQLETSRTWDSRPRRWPPRSLHHFVSHPPKEEGIGLDQVFHRVTM